MSIHLAGVIGLVTIFVIGTLRPINLGVLALVATFLVGALGAGETARELTSGFPVDLFVLLTGVTYLFGVAARNGTIGRLVDVAAHVVGSRRVLVPWMVFVLAALPAMAGAIGSAGVALLAPIAMRLAERCGLDRRMVGLMVVHGAAAGNFSPLNVLGAIVLDAMTTRGLAMSSSTLFVSNLACNVTLGFVIVAVFGGRRRGQDDVARLERQPAERPQPAQRFSLDQVCTLAAIAGVAVLSLGFQFSIGLTAFAAGAILQALFPHSSKGAEREIAWTVVLLVCGVVTYVNALERHGTVAAVGSGITGLGSPLLVALLLCAVGAVTSAFASSAGILGALVPLAAPLMAQGTIGATGLVVALALSATVVDAAPFSTVGALIVANASENEREHVYRGLLAWGAVMVLTAPLVTWLVFVLPAS